MVIFQLSGSYCSYPRGSKYPIFEVSGSNRVGVKALSASFACPKLHRKSQRFGTAYRHWGPLKLDLLRRPFVGCAKAPGSAATPYGPVPPPKQSDSTVSARSMKVSVHLDISRWLTFQAWPCGPFYQGVRFLWHLSAVFPQLSTVLENRFAHGV